ncbi:MAG TPA: cysteine--tRNA ligase [Candidatus Saccharimonadales bacterium]|nr:cysteine--tRNA ligase [Candidatus Saccharimonadales bacterium]
MKLYNTRTRNIEQLRPLEDRHVRIYSCGPTVYDHAHIGNLSAYIFADTLRRVVAQAGYTVTHAMNYTDVDDKTIRRSRERYPDIEPREALHRLADEYITHFLEDMAAVGNDTSALTFLRATDPEVIKGMYELITQLHTKGFAYIAEDGVYFSIDAYRKSGKTYGQLLELTLQNTSEARIHNDEYDKESVHDFALWKKQKDGEPAWPFTLEDRDGRHDLSGRPGWHIECSVMSRQALGQPFDIHTGGVDLIFPHHENEIAQSTALETNPVMATIFAHNAHILVDGKKMSKSANNFYTLKDITDKGYDPLAFRLLVLQSHYRSQTNFTWESLEAAQNRLVKLRNWAALMYQDSTPAPEHTSRISRQTIGSAFREALENDLDTPQALASIADDVISVTDDPTGGLTSQQIKDSVEFIDEVLGLRLSEVQDITPEQKQLIADREAARIAKDWQKADELRKRLEKQKIELRDTPQHTIWYRTA